MALTSGTRLGQYEILAPIGAGGMGEVYRARDTKLGRDVAIKVLPDEFSQDKERLERFEREARLLAQLNHANIATLHGLEEHDGQKFIVMELVEGETLGERIARGRIPLDEAVPLFIQIAEGLEAAHEKGIIHRDLKPPNIKIGPDGKPKILDFGLAKALVGERQAKDLSQSPTLTRGATETGVLLGTAPYMSPEQARGKSVDKRTDVWAFGCCLYEALTGRSPFLGETVTDTIAKIVERDPDWNALPERTPSAIYRLLHRCLQKKLDRRLRDVGDARIELENDEDVTETPTTIGEPEAGRRAGAKSRSAYAVAGLATGCVLTAAVFLTLIPRRTASHVYPAVARFSIDLPHFEGQNLGGLAFSLDGALLAYTGAEGLYLRAMDELESTLIGGTQGARTPFFSPDGRWLAFHADGKLRKVSPQGGAALTICDSPQFRGAAWGPGDTILFSPRSVSGLWQVPASGGNPEPVTESRPEEGEGSHRWPDILPDGKAVLFASDTQSSFDQAKIEVLSLETGERRVLVENATYPRYMPTGHLLFAQNESLWAAPFDLANLELTGVSVPLIENVDVNAGGGAVAMAVSSLGTLVYARGRGRQRNLVWVDRAGEPESLALPPGDYARPRLSRDGRSLAFSKDGDLWTYALDYGTLTRLTFHPMMDTRPIWTPDGSRITFHSNRGGASWKLFGLPADRTGEPEPLHEGRGGHNPNSWSPDGEVLAFTVETESEMMGDSKDTRTSAQHDVWTLSLRGNEWIAEPFASTPAGERGGMFSPDGRWMAYQSNESGSNEIYVSPFGRPGEKRKVSDTGGTAPIWARNGRELFYRQGTRMMAVAIDTGRQFTVGKPKLLFEKDYEIADYDITPDGRRFIMMKGEGENAITRVNVVLNWFDELRRLVPTDN